MAKMNNDELLQILEQNDIILSDVASLQQKMIKEKEILKKHPYKIWQGKNKKWFTYLTIDDEPKLRRRNSEEDIKRMIIKHYLDFDPYKNTFRKEFNDWIAKKEVWNEVDPSTIIRYRSDFRRFFPKGEKFADMDVADINDFVLEDFVKNKIVSENLTAKGYRNFRLLIRGTLRYAKKVGHTSFSVGTFFRDLDLSQRMFKRPSEKSRIIYSKDERKKIYDYCFRSGRIDHLAIALQCLTGLRVGELTTLKAEDNIEPGKLVIHRTEAKYTDEEGKVRIGVKDEAKQGHNGTIFIPKGAQKIIELAKMQTFNDEYLFSIDGKRITARQYNIRLKSVCEELGVEYKSSHKMRKTYASLLLEQNVDETIVQGQMRHKQIATTREYYYFNIESEENQRRIIDSVVAL